MESSLEKTPTNTGWLLLDLQGEDLELIKLSSIISNDSLVQRHITIFHATSFLTLRLLPKIAFSQLLGEVKPSPPAEMIVPLSESDAEYSLPFEKKDANREFSITFR